MCASGSNRKRRPASLVGYLLACCLTAAGSVAAAGNAHRVQDLYYGHALYQYFQQQELGAITQLMVANERPRRANSQIDESNLLLADLFYSYGLYGESRDMFASLLSKQVSPSIQNRIWFNLARLRHEQGYLEQARELLSRIDDRLPRRIEAERRYLMTSLHIADRQYDAAAKTSSAIDSDSTWGAYARYNLGVALVEDQAVGRGSELLDELGQMEPQDDEQVALRDLANLSLGLKRLRLGQFEAALEVLSRIRLEGPLSNQALLASGWGWYGLEQYDKARLPWRVLLERNATDAATQEAILAIPASYTVSGQDKLAIRYYKVAANQFELQTASLQDAAAAIDAGELIDALRETALLQDRGDLQRLPPVSDVTPQLHLLLASDAFHVQLKRYQELLDIRRSLGHWENSFPALELMLAERRRAFDQRLPQLEQTGNFARFTELSQKRDRFAAELEAIEAGEDFRALANTGEREQIERMQRVSQSIGKIGAQRNTGYQQDMLRLLSGMLDYRLATEYPKRHWKAKKQLILLDRALEEADARVLSLQQITERTAQEYGGFQQRIRGQVDRIQALYGRVDTLLLQQEKRINALAVNALEAQQRHIQQLHLNARFELARIYDKLTESQ